VSPAERALLQHLTAQPWADPPSAPVRDRRQSVATMLRLTRSEATAAAANLARAQQRRGVRTIDTATMGGSLGGAW